MCKAASKCGPIECPLAIGYSACHLKGKHITSITKLDPNTYPNLHNIAASCVDSNCYDCELSIPGTAYCGFSVFAEKAIVR